ncbi:ribonuclease H-like domain, reverse transcriptase, RNA-dependent DNA polymerase [Tanacetum coccineum]|uniref:Ribonuclease H-like domain, reverse transcriptase, RNA-dependent DNA polymerase n=1 Tax=Tanacetum coccineum TaxID=301880 RepID=A0ABQ5ARJ6_9ASTR
MHEERYIIDLKPEKDCRYDGTQAVKHVLAVAGLTADIRGVEFNDDFVIPSQASRSTEDAINHLRLKNQMSNNESDKGSMLDEAIDYLKTLKMQVQMYILRRVSTVGLRGALNLQRGDDFQNVAKIPEIFLISIHDEGSAMSGNSKAWTGNTKYGLFIPLDMAYALSKPIQGIRHQTSIRHIQFTEYDCMTRSSNKELVEPYDEPEQALHSLRKLFKTTSFDHSSSPEFELFSDYIEQIEEEITETRTEPTMEDGSKNKDANEHIERVFKIVDLFTTPDVTQDQLILRLFPISLLELQEVILFYKGLDVPTKKILDSKRGVPTMKADDAKKAIQEMADYYEKRHNGTSNRNKIGSELCDGSHYSKDCPLKEEGKTLEEAYYTQVGVPFPNVGRYRAAALGFYQRENGNPSFQERGQTMKESLSKFMAESAKRHDENSSLIKEIRASTDATIRNQGAFIKALEIQIGQMSKSIKLRRASVPFPGHLKEYGYDENEVLNGLKKLQLNSAASAESLRRLLKEKSRIEEEIKGIVENVLVGIDKFSFPVDFIVFYMPEDIKIPLILGRSFLSTAHAKTDVFKRKIALRIRNDKIVFKSDSPTNSIIKKVYVLGLRERMELDLEPRLMGEALILNRTHDPDFRDFLELNDLNKPLELRNNEIEDLSPTIKEGEVIDESMVDVVKIRHHNGMVEKINEYPNFTVMENMDAYRDKDMGDVIFGKLFCMDACVKARRFDGFITIHNGNNNVTYQMARSHPRFKHLSNEQCNKIHPLLKVSSRDKLEGNSHPYQKLKGFYKGVLNLGPEYIRDEKIFEWLTRDHARDGLS